MNNGEKYLNIHITGVGLYHPETKVTTEETVKHFNQFGDEAEQFAKSISSHLDRTERYRIKNNDDNVVTMAVKASRNAFANSGLSPSDIDMIVFISDNPEYTTPCTAMIIHNELGLKNSSIVFDLNNNCIGALTSMDFVSTYMKANKNIKNALIVGAQMVSLLANPADVILYGTVGDAAGALILQSREENEQRGILSSEYYVDSANCDKMSFPVGGMSKLFDESTPLKDKKMIFIPHDVSFFSEEWNKLIRKLLCKNSLEPSDIDHYIFSQFSHPDIYETLSKLGVDSKKHTFIADKYGYTGCTSPMFAYYHALGDKKINQNNYVVFCSVGIGFTMATLLYKY